MKAIFIEIAIEKAQADQQRVALQGLRDSHPDDLPIGADLLDKPEAIVTSVAEFLQRFPGNPEAEELE